MKIFYRNRFQLTHGQQWIEKCLMDRSISKQMITLLSDVNHLKEHYHGQCLCSDFVIPCAVICTVEPEKHEYYFNE